MAHILVRFKVEDYDNWRSVFNELTPLRSSKGSKGGNIYRSADNPNEIVILLEWDSIENVRQYTQSDELRAAMERSGVIGPPDFVFLDESEQIDV